MRRLRTALAGLVIIAAGCFGSGGDGASGPSYSASAQADCEMLLDIACDRIETCKEEQGGETAPPDFHQTCLDVQRTAFDCAKAVAVDVSFDECVEQLGSFTCAVFLTQDASGKDQTNLPASCVGVIKFP